ncbi:MAG: 30S ribosomal protein S12 methylthiotransferase RimO, partial [Candidatus Omnitrophica bacterium]|nr:30S ribosomal protein S12 methylthiotransferase RimO [Candidatus Omnitrophota bacterium]
RSQADAPEVDGLVYVNSSRLLQRGEFAEVKITDTLEYDLVGEIIQ